MHAYHTLSELHALKLFKLSYHALQMKVNQEGVVFNLAASSIDR